VAPVQRQPDVGGLVLDAQELPDAGLTELAPRTLPGHGLVLAHVGQRAQFPGLRRPGVDGDDRDAHRDGLPDRVGEGVRVGHRHDDAGHLVRDRGVDHVGLLVRLARGLVLDGNAEVGAGLFGALLDHVPERVTGRAVRDHGEGAAGSARRTGGRLRVADLVAPGERQRHRYQSDDAVDPPSCSHVCASYGYGRARPYGWVRWIWPASRSAVAVGQVDRRQKQSISGP
jgi:hypothetical protein